ncbi:MAG TPA: gamma-glutamyltransferase, partial [Methylomirabilota bacterium]|nr:gamma-glutamyltransferase [Methylomirabilota bacterium]
MRLPLMRMMAAVGFTCLAAAWTVLDAAAEPRQAVTTHRDMVVAANPLAAQAGLDILRAGGNAIVAAVAVQMVLNLV